MKAKMCNNVIIYMTCLCTFAILQLHTEAKFGVLVTAQLQSTLYITCMLTFAERPCDSADDERVECQPTERCGEENAAMKEASSGTSTRSEQLERIEALSVEHYRSCIMCFVVYYWQALGQFRLTQMCPLVYVSGVQWCSAYRHLWEQFIDSA